MIYGGSCSLVRDNVLIAIGGAGGMAVVIDLATVMIEGMLRRSTKLSEFVDAFILEVRKYVPPEQMTEEEKACDVGGLQFGNPPIMFTQYVASQGAWDILFLSADLTLAIRWESCVRGD
jgi:hypothetical protein